MPPLAIVYLQAAAELAPEREPEAGCEIVARVADDGHGEHSGLAAALHRIAAGEADTLLVSRLHTAAGSLGALLSLLDWLDAAGAGLLAADVELDTRDRAGRKTVALLREVERWGHERDAARRPPGRPGLSHDAPALAQRIALLRERGLSLQSIADTLDREGVPTPRGGARWRASSVQSALGYRRPRPPAPGAPRRSARGPEKPARKPPRPGDPGKRPRQAPGDAVNPPRLGDPGKRPRKAPGDAVNPPRPGDRGKRPRKAPRGAAHPPPADRHRGPGPSGRPAGRPPRDPRP